MEKENRTQYQAENRMQLTKQEADRISACPLFQNLTEEKLKEALAFFHAERKTAEKGEMLKKPGDRLPFFGLLLYGSMEVALDDPDGHHLVMAHVEKGQTFGESLCYLGEKNPVSITALADSCYLRMNTEKLKETAEKQGSRGCEDRSGGAMAARMTDRFITVLAKRTLQMNQRIQILSKLSIREKLLTFLRLRAGETGSVSVRVPMNREELADWLGCNRSALSRELSEMKKEGILTIEGNSFTIR